MLSSVPSRLPIQAFAGVALGSALALCLPVPTALAGNVESGRNLEVAPAIDYVLFEGAPELNGRDVRIDVTRGTTLVATKTARVSGGLTEVNHVGGADCFDGDGTPDLRAGDKVMVTVVDDPTDVDWTYARGIRFTEQVPGTLRGTAFGNDAPGGAFSPGPLALGADLLEAKRVGDARADAPIDAVAANGDWTVQLAVDASPTAETFVDWVGAATGGGSETTTGFPDGEAGEQPCGPLRQSALTMNDHPVINAANVQQPMVVGGPLGGLGTATEVALGGTTHPVDNGPDSWTATIPPAALAALADNTEHALVARFSDGTSDNRSVLKDVTIPTLTTSLAGGTYVGDQATSLASSEAGTIRYTLDGAPLPDTEAGTPYAGIPIALAAGRSHVLHARTQDAAGNVATLGPVTYVVRQPAPPPAPPAAPTDGGTAAAGGAPGGVTAAAVVAAGAPVPPTVLPSQAPLVLRWVLGPPKMRLRTARRDGIRFKAGVPDGAKVLRVRVSRRTGRGHRHVVSVTVPTAAPGTVIRRLATFGLRGKLRRGTYRFSVAAGRSTASFGPERSFDVALKG